MPLVTLFRALCLCTAMAMATSTSSLPSSLTDMPPDFFSAPSPPLRSHLSIPFHWEEAPGIPKPCTDVTPYRPPPFLNPPPGLLQRPATCLDRSLSSKTLPSPRTPRQDSPVAAKMKGFWHKMVARNKKDDAPWSPTSTLFGPEAGKRGLFPSLSSVSSASVPDLSLPFSPKSSETHSRQSSLAEPDDESDAEESMSSLPVVPSGPVRRCRDEKASRRILRKRASESVLHVLKLCKAGVKWRHFRTQQKRTFSETAMWEPTLATYFHSMEIEQESSTEKPLAIMDKEPDGAETYNSDT